MTTRPKSTDLGIREYERTPKTPLSGSMAVGKIYVAPGMTLSDIGMDTSSAAKTG